MSKMFYLLLSMSMVMICASNLLAAVTSDGSAPVYKPEILDQIEKDCVKAVAEGTTPVVVFDLDSTLMNNNPRNRAIIEEFAESAKAKYPDFLKAVKAMKDEQIAYSLDDTLKNIGVTDDKILKELKKVWYDSFFTDKYVVLDTAYDGAADFVKKLHGAGTKIVYLTGRDTPDMSKGTVESLKKYGFPIEDSASVLLTKPEKKIKDDDFKRTASEDIKKMGKVVASFDNEPKNANLFIESFPDAKVVFVETNHSPRAVPVDKRLPWIKGWKPAAK